MCGSTLTGNTTAGGSSGDRRAAYRCRTADRSGKGHVVRDVERLDQLVEGVAVARLKQPDTLETLLPDPMDTAPLHAEAGALRARLDEAARGWAAGVLTQAQLTAATTELRTRLEAVEQQIGQAGHGSALAGLVDAVDPQATWDGLPLDRRRAVLALLVTVTVLPRTRRGRLPGGGYFDPNAVRIDWR